MILLQQIKALIQMPFRLEKIIIRIILNAVYSLKFYYEQASNEETGSIKSILIIDEFDATLHPSMQIKLTQIIMDFSLKYKIQVFFTTHAYI